MTRDEIRKKYEELVCSFSKSFKGFKLDKLENKIEDYANRCAELKSQETHHLHDHNKELKRIKNGRRGEMAVEALLSIDICDWTVGDSTIYNYPDVPGYNVGIKTSEKWNFPVIPKNNTYPQIICVVNDKNPNHVFVCGLATVDILNKYQSDEYIVDPNLRQRGTKTCFYGFEHLIPITSLKDIEKYKRATD